MKKPVVDYRKLRLNNITSPEYRHLLLLLGWLVYFAGYFLTEGLIPYENCHVVHCALDDMIPFCEWFLIPYFSWYLLIVGSLLYFLLYDVDAFRRLSIFIMITQGLALIWYSVWPSIQLLRPEVFPRDNLLTRVIGLLYRFDTPTGVCPSLHVAYSLGIASVWCREKAAPLWVKLGVVFAVLVIILSTFFIKQHSVVDAAAAVAVSAVAELAVHGPWRKKRKAPRSGA